MLHIRHASCSFEPEPLAAPFGFKGRSVTTLWQSAVYLEDEKGVSGCAPGVQSVVWSDAAVFERLGQSGGNAAMYLITAAAVDMVRGKTFGNPIGMLHEIFDALMKRARQITGIAELRPTFVLNALVPLDLAAWQLYARRCGCVDFEAMVPAEYRMSLSCRHWQLAGIPLLTYQAGEAEARRLAAEGACLFKIKLGCDPDGDGDWEKMLRADQRRVRQLHDVLKDYVTPHTDTGRIAYYFDANGRYDSRERLERLLDDMDAIGALERTVLLEEPFEEHCGIDVHGLPVRIAADESAHAVADVEELIGLGYTAVALKPIAKTLSVSLEVLTYATERGIPCFCADLTVNPLMVDWNKNVAARIPAIPGLKAGVLETNGSQNYPDWERLKSYHPLPHGGWVDCRSGLFTLDEEFYRTSGGIFLDSAHYRQLARDI